MRDPGGAEFAAQLHPPLEQVVHHGRAVGPVTGHAVQRQPLDPVHLQRRVPPLADPNAFFQER